MMSYGIIRVKMLHGIGLIKYHQCCFMNAFSVIADDFIQVEYEGHFVTIIF